MATERQIDANRNNSKKSTGPKSAEGKRTAGQNAIRHGLLTAATLVAGEAPAEFQEFAGSIRNHYRPQTAMEEVQVARITDCLWRLQRLMKVEAGAFAPVEEPGYHTDIQKIGLDPDSIPPDKQAQSEAVNPGAIERQFAFSARIEQFEVIQRYEAHIERKLGKATEELERLQFARIQNVHPYHIRRMRRFVPLDRILSQAQESAEGSSAHSNTEYSDIPREPPTEFSPSAPVSSLNPDDPVGPGKLDPLNSQQPTPEDPETSSINTVTEQSHVNPTVETHVDSGEASGPPRHQNGNPGAGYEAFRNTEGDSRPLSRQDSAKGRRLDRMGPRS